MLCSKQEVLCQNKSMQYDLIQNTQPKCQPSLAFQVNYLGRINIQYVGLTVKYIVLTTNKAT